MAAIATDLDFLQQKRLHDTNEIIWSRAELLGYYDDGYRRMLALSHASRRFTALPVPPRFTMTGSQPWMARFANGGTYWQYTHQTVGGWAATSLWQIDALEGIANPTASSDGFTQPWMRAFLNPRDMPFRFALPRDNERIVKLWYNDRLLVPIMTRRLDDLQTNWMSLEGEPLAWVMGTGRNRTFEVFQVVTSITDTFETVDDVTNEKGPLFGIPRRITGDRTYANSTPDTLPYGGIRRIVSPDVSYYPRVDAPLRNPVGRAYSWGSSSNALLVLEAHISEIGGLDESDEPVLVPPQMQKYLRHYVLFRAFNRRGQGYNPNMAALYEQRFMRGARLFQRLHMLTRKDNLMARDSRAMRGRRPPRVQFPADFPRVLH